MNQITTGKLMEDLRVVVGNAEELLKATASQTGERMQELRTRTEQSLGGARARLDAATQEMGRSGREAAGQLDSQVRGHPWTAVGVAAAFGLLVGILVGRS